MVVLKNVLGMISLFPLTTRTLGLKICAILIPRLIVKKVRDTQLVLGGLLHQQRKLPHEVTAELVLL